MNIYKIDDKREEVPIVFLGDVHYGHTNCNMDEFLKKIKWIEENNAYVILMGDLLEVCNPNHLPNTMWHQEYNPMMQRNNMLTILADIKDRIIGLISGNHELRVFN